MKKNSGRALISVLNFNQVVLQNLQRKYQIFNESFKMLSFCHRRFYATKEQK